jgi:hypothetical protein
MNFVVMIFYLSLVEQNSFCFRMLLSKYSPSKSIQMMLYLHLNKRWDSSYLNRIIVTVSCHLNACQIGMFLVCFQASCYACSILTNSISFFFFYLLQTGPCVHDFHCLKIANDLAIIVILTFLLKVVSLEDLIVCNEYQCLGWCRQVTPFN